MSTALALDFEPTCVVEDDTRRLPGGWPESSAPPSGDPQAHRLAALLGPNAVARTGAAGPEPLLAASVGTGVFLASCRPLLPGASGFSGGFPRLQLDAVRLLRTTADRLRDLQVTLSLNKSQLAAVLRVSRPTLYQWLDGNEPSMEKATRVDQLCRLASETGVSGSAPLSSLFVHRRLQPGEPSLLEQLAKDELNEQRVRALLKEAKGLTRAKRAERNEREERLRRLGYAEPTEREKREALIDDELWRDFSED